MLYGIPSIAALLFLAFGWQLSGAVAVMTATSILVGVMITVFVFLSELRIKIQEVQEYRVRPNLKRLVASSSVGALYVSTLSIALTFLLALIASVPVLSRDDLFGHISSAAAIWLLVHLIVFLGAILRKLFGVYVALFGEDFMVDSDSD